MADLSIGANPFTYSGGAAERVIASDGTITVDLWGGAGGGGYFTGTGGPGGGGGYTRIVLNVSTGDVVKIETGQGGRKAIGPTSNGGLGGWPDGGAGGAYAALASTLGTSGGGGSSRLWINNVLVAVAGAGGGGLAGGGAGGGSDGLDASPQAGVDNSTTGASQTQGGYAAVYGGYGITPSLIRGSYLQGGNGWGSNSGDQNANNSTPSEYTGCGGGGGYYGGSGGRAGERQFGSGGGGSGYLASALGNYVSGSTTAGSGATPNDGIDANRPSGVAVGGVTAGGSQTDGGDGYVYIFFESAAIPADAEGDVGTITLTTPAGSATGVADTSGLLATQTWTAPEAVATGEALAAGDIGTMTLTPPVGESTATATIVVPINDDVDLVWTPPEGEAVGEFTPIEIELPGPLTWYAPEATAGVPIDVSGDVGTMTWTPPEATAEAGIQADGEAIPDLVWTPPEAVATGSANAVAQTVGEGDNRVIAQILLGEIRSPQAYVETIGEATGLAFPGVLTWTPPEGMGYEGVFAVAEVDSELTWTAPEATATGDALATPPAQGGIEHPAGIFLAAMSWTQKPAASATGAADVTGGSFTKSVALRAPNPIIVMSANLAVAFARRLEWSPPQGMIIFEGEALGYGDIGTMTWTPPEAIVLVDGAGEDALAVAEDFPTLTFTPPEATVSVAADVVVAMPTIYWQAPEAYVEVRDDEGNLPPAFAPLRFKRTLVPGRAPNSLQDREIALNEADGVLYTRDSEGQVVETDYLMLAEGGFTPEGGSEGQVLSDSGVWIDPEVVYDAPIRVPDASGTRIALVDGVTGAQNVSTTAGRVYYRPFFVPKTLQITDLGVEVVTTGSGIAHLGICGWSLGGQPGETLLSGQVSTAISGLRVIAGEVTLQPGWYAAMFAFTGVGMPSFRAARGSPSLDEDFLPLGDPSADFDGDLDPAPAPEQFEPAALGYLSAECA